MREGRKECQTTGNKNLKKKQKKTNADFYIFIKIQKSMKHFCTKLLATKTDCQTQIDGTEEDARHSVYFLQLWTALTIHM